MSILYKEQNKWIRPRLKLLEYQIRFFENELRKEEKALKRLIENTPKREKAYAPKFKTERELNEAYIAGVIKTDKEYIREKANQWTTYSDRGHKARIAWLRGELSQYQNQMQMLEEHLEELRKARRERTNAYKRKPRPYRKTRERLAREKEERKRIEKERWEACAYWKRNKHSDEDEEGDE